MNSAPTSYRAAFHEAWIAVDGGAVADDGHHRSLGNARRTPMAAGSAKPRPPIAALTKPSGRRAGMRACSSGRGGRFLDQDGVGRQTLRERGQHVPGLQRLTRAWRLGAGGRRICCGDGRRGSIDVRARATARRRREQRQFGGAPVDLRRVVRDDDHRVLSPTSAPVS